MNVFAGPIATGSPNPESCSSKIVCAGNLVADIFFNPIAAVPAAGQLALTERLLFGAGGCATNSAACLRRLGSPVTVLGKVGDDVLGNLVIEDLKRLGIDASSVSRSRMHPTSGTVIINVTGEDRLHRLHRGQRRFFFFGYRFLGLEWRKSPLCRRVHGDAAFRSRRPHPAVPRGQKRSLRPFSTLSFPQAIPFLGSKWRQCWLTPMSFCPMTTKLMH